MPSWNSALEAAIDSVGRDRVFDRAVALGWRHGDPPPEWVWWGIVDSLRSPLPSKVGCEGSKSK